MNKEHLVLAARTAGITSVLIIFGLFLASSHRVPNIEVPPHPSQAEMNAALGGRTIATDLRDFTKAKLASWNK